MFVANIGSIGSNPNNLPSPEAMVERINGTSDNRRIEKQMFTKLISVTVLLTLGSTAVIFGVQDPLPTQKNASKFMARKLDSSRSIVAGLATENYDLISKSAQDLMLLSHESNWNVIQSQQYLRMSNDFRRSAERLRDAANEKNIDGSTLEFFDVTLNCVRCHKYVRKSHPELKQK